MNVRVACLSPYDEATIRAMFQGGHEVEVVLVAPPPAQSAVLAACAGADLVIGDQRHKHRVDRQVLEHMRGCKLVQMPSVGFDTVDYRAAAELGIPVANAAGYNKESVADWTLMAMIALLRHSFHGDRAMRAGRWRPDDPVRNEMLGRELGAATVGIIGLGNVGSSVARRLTAFGSRILFTDVVTRDFAGAERVDFDTLLRQSDIVCVHTPLDVDTGALIALIDALGSGHLAGAGLDVYEVEPLAIDSPLRALENVLLSPRAGGATVEADARLMEVVGENFRRALDGQALLNAVNAVKVGAP